MIDRTPLSQERWDLMIQSHREDPGNVERAARAAHCNWRTAKAAWERGTRGREAISAVIAKEQQMRRGLIADDVASRSAEAERIKLELREKQHAILDEIGTAEDVTQQRVALLQQQVAALEARSRALTEASRRQQAAQLERGKVDGDDTRRQETALVRGVRAYHLAVMGALAGALRPAAVANLAQALTRATTDPNMDPVLALRLATRLVSFAKPLAEAAKINAETERLVTGHPTAITEHHEVVTLDAAGIAEARAEFERIARQLEEACAEEAAIEAEEVTPELPAPEDDATAEQPSEPPGG